LGDLILTRFVKGWNVFISNGKLNHTLHPLTNRRQ